MVVKCQYLTPKIVSGQALNITSLWLEVAGLPAERTCYGAAIFCLVFTCYFLKWQLFETVVAI